MVLSLASSFPGFGAKQLQIPSKTLHGDWCSVNRPSVNSQNISFICMSPLPVYEIVNFQSHGL
jgi:hypothetical protein